MGLSKKRFLAPAIALLAFALIAGSARSGTQSPKTSRSSGASHTLVVAAVAVSAGLDTEHVQPGTQSEVFSGLNEPLLGYPSKSAGNGFQENDTSKFVGLLAKSWTRSPNGLSYTFTLKPGIKSDYGNELTAYDVKWSWDKAYKEAGTGAALGSIASLTNVTVVSKYKVRFNLSAPSTILLPTLTLGVPAIYDATEMRKHATAADPYAVDWLNSGHFAGFGPYMVKSMQAGSQATFVANPYYYRGKPYFTTVIYRQVTDPTVRAQLLKSGAIDFDEQPTAQDLENLAGVKTVTTAEFPSTEVSKIIMNTGMAPFNNRLLRQAISYATPYNQIVNVVFHGKARVAEGPIPSVVPGYDPSVWPYKTNIAKAKALLARAGYPNGINLTLEYSNAKAPYEQAVAVQEQSGLALAGINVTLQQITPDAAQTGAAHRTIPFFMWEDPPFVTDPAFALGVYYTPSGCCDRGAYDNRQVNTFVKELTQSSNTAARLRLTRAAQKIINASAPAVFVAEVHSLVAMGSDIGGYIYYIDQHERWFQLTRK